MTTDMHKAPSVARKALTSRDDATPVARYDLSTSEGGRRYIADFFATELRRHDFAGYINTHLAADFACALAQHLAATAMQQVGGVQGDARAQFEAWAKGEGWKDDEFERYSGGRCATAGEYHNSHLEALWYGWKSALAARQPVEYHGDVDLKWLAGSIGEVGHRLRTYMPHLAEWTDRARDCGIAAKVLEVLAARQPGAQEPVRYEMWNPCGGWDECTKAEHEDWQRRGGGKTSRALYDAPPAQGIDLGEGVKAIAAERERQLQAEGFTRDGDQQYRRGELAKAATAYVQLAALDLEAGTRDHIAWHGPAAVWPWAPEWWKPVDARRDLVRAGALIAAQIDLIDSQRDAAPGPRISQGTHDPSGVGNG